jgi:hypothetical protein
MHVTDCSLKTYKDKQANCLCSLSRARINGRLAYQFGTGLKCQRHHGLPVVPSSICVSKKYFSAQQNYNPNRCNMQRKQKADPPLRRICSFDMLLTLNRQPLAQMEALLLQLCEQIAFGAC